MTRSILPTVLSAVRRPGLRGSGAARAAWRSQRGSYSLETVFFALGFFTLLGLLIIAGRVHLAGGAADSAAKAAAREASLQRSPGTAEVTARQAARESLSESGLRCEDMEVALDVSGLESRAGQAATVEASVACTVALGDVGIPGVPGHKTLRSEFTSTVDTFRAR